MRRRRWIGAALALAAAAGCGCGCGKERAASGPGREGQAQAPAPAATAGGGGATGAADGCTLAALPDRLPAAARVVAIGDLHGDLAASRAALRAASLIDEDDRWTGGDTVVVQTGDVLDRGDDEPEILALIARLEREAAAAGGAFVALDGNHELLNVAGELSYVTPGGFADYAAGAGASSAPPEIPGPARGRFAAFRPGGPIARELAGRRVGVIVGDTVFAHAGPSAGDDLAALNRAARCWLAGQGPVPPALEDPESLVWTRAYGGDPADCARLDAALASLGVARMVVGHTVQADGINAACDGRLWRIDVGMSAAYGGPIEVLELRGGAVEVLRGARR